MKRGPTKAELRDEIARQVRDYLGEGGEIDEVERGASGLDKTELPPRPEFTQPRQSRTPVPEVVAAIEARKRPPQRPKRPSRKQPRKKAIYDDFGEPIRWIWAED
ncbi:hypothetical protein [Motiliproteus sp. SC1-56]|uniref:hypothetical protein n=1 Tax=Motiliproteus sp. SC1-56 TaxID=2799565 RepID=UPI001A8F33F7|nr:hypothetical protein [Motiliproteus sp. SC1-56]